MGVLNQPAELGMMIEQLESRIRALEVTARLGLNRMRNSYATAAADPTTFAAWETGTAGSTWADDRGGTGTGYGQLSVDVNTAVLVIVGARIINIGNDAGASWRTTQGLFGFGVDGAAPNIGVPSGQRTFSNFNPATLDINLVHAVVRRGMTPGAHTFNVQAQWNNDYPGAPIKPRLTDATLVVLPID